MKSQRISKKAKTIFYKVALAWDLRNHVRAIFVKGILMKKKFLPMMTAIALFVA